MDSGDAMDSEASSSDASVGTSTSGAIGRSMVSLHACRSGVDV